MILQTHSQISRLRSIRSIPVPTGEDSLLVPVNIGKKMNKTIQKLSDEYGCDRTKLIRFLIDAGLESLQPIGSIDLPRQHGSAVEGRSE
jgi:hypothetical protein